MEDQFYRFRLDQRIFFANDANYIRTTEHLEPNYPSGVPNPAPNQNYEQIGFYGSAGELMARMWYRWDTNSGEVVPSGRFHGTWTTDVAVTTSDRKLKTNIQNLETTLKGRSLEELRPVSFEYANTAGQTRYGFIAQELRRTLPEVVRKRQDPGEDSHLGVAYLDMLAVLTTMIQGLAKEAGVLQPRMEAVENRIRQRKKWKRSKHAKEKLRAATQGTH